MSVCPCINLLRGVRVPHWLENRLLVTLYGLGQCSPHEVAYEVELGPSVIFYMVAESGLRCLGPHVMLSMLWLMSGRAREC